MSLQSDHALWLKSYPEGIAPELDFAEGETFLSAVEESLTVNAANTAVRCLGTDMTYAELDEASRAFAAALQSLKLSPGARVALMMPSLPQYLVCLLGVLRGGFVATGVNPLYTPREMRHQLADSGAEALVILEQFAAGFESIRSETQVKHVILTSVGDVFGGVKRHIANFKLRKLDKAVPAFKLPGALRYREMLSRGAKAPWAHPTPKPEDVAVLQYTGGTTGIAKGAMLSQRNLLAAMRMSGAWLAPALEQAPRVAAPVGVMPLPLYHVYTLYTTAMLLSQGGCSVQVPNPRDLGSLIKAMKAQPFHLMTGLNTLYAGLLAHPDMASVDVSHTRVFIAGGTSTHHHTAEAWHALTGNWITEGWGMSETSGAGTCNPWPTPGFTHSIGVPMPSVLVEIRDEDGTPLPHDQPGELWVKGPHVMSGYWQMDEDPFDANGFLATGDVAMMDDVGFIHIVDRKKDMILVSGFNVYPNEIEEVLSDLEGVLEAAAVGVPDAKTGESVKVFVVKKDPALTEADVRAHCSTALTNYKRPSSVVFLDELPKTPVGKIMRRMLRER